VAIQSQFTFGKVEVETTNQPKRFIAESAQPFVSASSRAKREKLSLWSPDRGE